MYEKYGEEVEFFVVYVREAHPTDGWQVGVNSRDKVLFAQPKTLDERIDVAHSMCEQLKMSIPTLIDNMEDTTEKNYQAHPDRLYLVGKDGKSAFQGAPGPVGFRPEVLEEALVKELERDAGR